MRNHLALVQLHDRPRKVLDYCQRDAGIVKNSDTAREYY